MAAKRPHAAMNPPAEEQEPVDPSDELMFLALGGGNEVGRSCHIIQYKGEKEEKGVDDVTDVMHGSGINLKDEENYLHTLYTNQHTAKDSFGTQGSSFGSGTLSGGNSFNTLQGTSFDGNGALAGTLGQPLSQDDVEKEAKRKREKAAREKAERDQHHLNNPFLLGNVLRLRMDKIAKENSVRLDVNGLYLLQQPEPTKVMTNGANSEGIVRAGRAVVC